MISSTLLNSIPAGEQYIEGVCLSTDSKPTEGIANGSRLIEMDTGTIYYYDKDGEQWLAFGAQADNTAVENNG